MYKDNFSVIFVSLTHKLQVTSYSITNTLPKTKNLFPMYLSLSCVCVCKCVCVCVLVKAGTYTTVLSRPTRYTNTAMGPGIVHTSSSILTRVGQTLVHIFK